MTSVFMGCSDVDAHIPLERFKETGRVLQGMGGAADVQAYLGMAHTIVQEELDRAGWVRDELDTP